MASDVEVEFLRCAAGDTKAMDYVLSSLYLTLADLGLSSEAVRHVEEVLTALDGASADEVRALIGGFREARKDELEIIYKRNYFRRRYDFVHKAVHGVLQERSVRKVLDLGCGEGFFGQWLLRNRLCKNVAGWDVVEFHDSWNRLSAAHESLTFSSAASMDFTELLSSEGRVDAIFLVWVLHHASDGEVARILEGLSSCMDRGALVVVIEDAFMRREPWEDPFDLWRSFRRLVGPTKAEFPASAGFAHGLLDFVAVRLLADYGAVALKWNYKSGEMWCERFGSFGFRVVESEFIGFPRGRDIGVPEALLVFERGG